jgi:hypothetical protein
MAYQVCITQKSRRIFLRLCHIILYYMHPERNYIHYLRNPSEYSCFFNYCCGRHVCDYLCSTENFVRYRCFGLHTTRLPGYALIYLIFRYLLPKIYAIISIVILHILVEAVFFYLYTHTNTILRPRLS